MDYSFRQINDQSDLFKIFSYDFLNDFQLECKDCKNLKNELTKLEYEKIILFQEIENIKEISNINDINNKTKILFDNKIKLNQKKQINSLLKENYLLLQERDYKFDHLLKFKYVLDEIKQDFLLI